MRKTSSLRFCKSVQNILSLSWYSTEDLLVIVKIEVFFIRE